MPKEPDYYTVIEEEDGTLSCNCPGSRQTGKTCEHTFGVKLEIDFGNVERYNDLETIRKTRGKAARGQKNNPAKKKPGRQPQRRSDRTVTADLDRFLDQVKNKINPWESDSDSHGSNSTTSEETDGNADALGIDDPLNRTGSQLSKGRAPATGPLHPGRTSGKGKKSDISPDDTANLNGPVKFSNPPGAKRGHPSSLLPGSSPLKKEADEKEKKVHAVRLAEEHKRKQEEEEEKKREEKRDKRRRKEEKKLEKLRQKRLAEREPEDQANESQMFSSVDQLERWDNEVYQMREDEGQGFTDIAMALSCCLGSATLVLPSYFRQLARHLRTMDWGTAAHEIIDRANAEALLDRTKADEINLSEAFDKGLGDGSLFQHLNYYAMLLVDTTTVLFLHRDEDEEGREHWLLFRHSGKKVDCFEPLENHQKIRDRRNIIEDMYIVTAYFRGDEFPVLPIKQGYKVLSLNVQVDGAACGFWATVLCILQISGIDISSDDTARRLRKLKIRGVKQHLKEIWTSWQINEEGLEEEALNALLRPVASRPPWIARAEEHVPKEPEVSRELPPNHTVSKLGPGKKKLSDNVSLVSSDDDEMILELWPPDLSNHLYRISSLDGWFNCDVINVWATHLDSVSPHTKVLQNGFYNQLRKIHEFPGKKGKEYDWERAIRGTRKVKVVPIMTGSEAIM
ncbi:hypothetical protein B0H10DRAFT_1966545 [Mycena sp. CBHHK59/15]|nr:hypothetical protein B0H10DRAFT_1966545 [Mycena sp. CBHHK59/15]